MKVKDIMTVDVISVSPDTKITEIAQILFKNRIHAVPVIDEGKKIVGIVAEDDFFTRDASNVFLPSYIEFIKGTKIVDALVSEKQEKLNKLTGLEAKDIMTKECITVMEDLELNGLLDFFRETRFTSLPVTDKQNKLVGIITISDIIGMIKA